MASVSDAVLGNATGWANVADIIAQTGLRQQQTEESKAQTQERLLNVLMNKQAFANTLDYQKALQANAVPAAADGSTPGASSAPAPGPASIAASRAIDSDPTMTTMRELQKDKSYITNNNRYV